MRPSKLPSLDLLGGGVVPESDIAESQGPDRDDRGRQRVKVEQDEKIGKMQGEKRKLKVPGLRRTGAPVSVRL